MNVAACELDAVVGAVGRHGVLGLAWAVGAEPGQSSIAEAWVDVGGARRAVSASTAEAVLDALGQDPAVGRGLTIRSLQRGIADQVDWKIFLALVQMLAPREDLEIEVTCGRLVDATLHAFGEDFGDEWRQRVGALAYALCPPQYPPTPTPWTPSPAWVSARRPREGRRATPWAPREPGRVKFDVGPYSEPPGGFIVTAVFAHGAIALLAHFRDQAPALLCAAALEQGTIDPLLEGIALKVSGLKPW